MAKVQLSLAAAALASLKCFAYDKASGREEEDVLTIDPGATEGFDLESDKFNYSAAPIGDENPKKEGNEAVVTVEADEDNEKAVVLKIRGPAGVAQEFTLKGGDKRIFSLYEGQVLDMSEGASIV
ncbi:hypothetical protein CPT_Sansa53 [Caulobacter phage Sansa]|uniref:Uncharacterized protein n=1 Tax=Caulobacter phage Sansa TaxID=1675600 RepID=A0A0K1LLS1_9CAUD|nr:hypothetical protein HOR07_gp053 [Caulobacter phage Sansa]AKU43457.1 hypothetical protein CPT_Sansa53 [Caulobacter phage Sansa]